MLKLEDVLQLKDDEEVKLITRRHPVTLFPGLFVAFLLIVIPFFLLFPLFSWGVLGVVLFLVSVLLGIGTAICTFILWDADVLIVTTFRIVDVDQRGVFTRMVSETPLHAIQDVSWKRHGMLETMLHIGLIRIQGATATAPIEVGKISNPDRLNEFITDLRHRTQPKRHDVEPERNEQLKRISKLLEGFSADELGRVETILKARERTAVTEAFLAKDEAEKA